MPLGAFKAALMGTAGVSAGADVVLLSSQTAASDTTLSFTSGIDSTYGEYIFKFYHVAPETDYANFQIQFSTDGGSNYDETLTTTFFSADHTDDDHAAAALGYITSHDLAQETEYHDLTSNQGNDAGKGCGSGELHLFSPASTTYVKHFYSNMCSWQAADQFKNAHSAGYINTTSAVNAVSIKFSSGDWTGKVKMWGVK